VLYCSDAAAAKICRKRKEAAKALAKQVAEGRMRDKRVKDNGVGWELRDDLIDVY
jgi:hypothetical protein